MQFTLSDAESYVPDGTVLDEACKRTTHLAVGAHQDDLEIMAYDGIIQCFQQTDRWFSAVVVTNGGGSPRSGLYGDLTDEEMMAVRRKEQKKAALIGDYSVQFLLNHPSASVKDANNPAVVNDLRTVLEATRPEVVYTHNPADKHDTHVGVTVKLIEAIRSLPAEARPGKVYGCEVWRDLDWMCDTDKVVFDLSSHENLQASLLGVFDSQVSGGKRYDLATMGRRRAHATFFASHNVDTATSVSFAMDLTPLIEDDTLAIRDLVNRYMRHFLEEIEERITKIGG